MNDWKTLVGKQVKIFLKDSIIYHGRVIAAGDSYIQIVDKFEKTVYIVLDNVQSIEEER